MELLSYTRMPEEDIIYGNRMAYSMHLAYRESDGISVWAETTGRMTAKTLLKIIMVAVMHNKIITVMEF